VLASVGGDMNWRVSIEPVVRPLLHTWWRLSRGLTLGVRGVVARDDGCIVLVKHTYVSGWHLPGGGVEAGESAQFSMTRELMEEAGIKLLEPPCLVSVHSNHRHFRGDHVMVFKAAKWVSCETDNSGEIQAVEWFDPHDLPEDVSPGTRRRLDEIYHGRPKSEDW
jgi:ADP-ribose pyrophosphatase YjhB (NUDIX family)